MKIKLAILDGEFTVHRLPLEADIPSIKDNFFSITHTAEELSIVCDSNTPIQSKKSEGNWVCIKVLGPLDFALTGILAKISTVLAEAKISIFAISTYDTDYILVKSNTIEPAKNALKKAGYIFEK